MVTRCDFIVKIILDYLAKMIISNIENDRELLNRYRDKIPVIWIDGEESFVCEVYPITLKKKLEKILAGRE